MPEQPDAALRIALEEYVYWRHADHQVLERSPGFMSVVTGAIGASANIAERIYGAGKFAGIDYRALTPEEITKILLEIRLAPRMLEALISIVGKGRRGDFLGPSVRSINTEGQYGIGIAQEILRELELIEELTQGGAL